MRVAAAVLIAVAARALVWAQDAGDLELAKLLSEESTRASAVRTIVASGAVKLPLLLSWAEKPTFGMALGLADVFGELKTKEAIPFLIRHIGIIRSMTRPNIWLKTDSAIEGHLAAVGALVKIGPEASKALVKIPLERWSREERLAVIFTVARIADPEARDFLVYVRRQAIGELEFAEEGLKRIEQRAKQ